MTIDSCGVLEIAKVVMLKRENRVLKKIRYAHNHDN